MCVKKRLYGHERDTTPKLNAIRDELAVFTDVISPRPYTIEALQQVLSCADSKHPGAFFEQPTLLNIMKQAGYDKINGNPRNQYTSSCRQEQLSCRR